MTQPYFWALRGLPTRAAVCFTQWLARAGTAWLLLALLPLEASAQTPTATFVLQANSPSAGAGSGPVSVAIADVNGDGRLDALTANSGNSTLGVLLGDGKGGFTLQANSPSTGTGSRPQSVAIADVNGDGRLDALTANNGNSTLGVLLGDGKGGFTLQANSPSAGTGSRPQSVAIADVNGDGQPDALTANSGNSTLGVLLGDGKGGFTLQANSPSTGGSFPQSVAIADVNGDGRPDALTPNANGGNSTLGVLLGDGKGGFTLQANSPSTGFYSFPYSVAIADVNGDGRPDALTPNYTAGTLGVLLGDGKGGFTLQANSPSTGGSSPYSVAIADVNGDGRPDALTPNPSGTLGVLLNTTVYAPTLTNLNPTSGSVGTSITLTGTNLGGATGVSFNGTAATTFAVVNSTTVTATVPTGATSGNVTVTTPGGISNGLAFAVVSAPTISSFSPVSGVAGTPVTLSGTNLSGATSVRVNGVAVTPTNVTATSLSFVVPARASATQSITVTTPGGTSAASTAFAVLLQVASTSPAANARTAPTANSATAVTFTEPVSAASAASLKVFSAQLGGKKAGTVTVSGSTASFAATASTPRTNFKPGETVSVSVPATILGAGGLAATPYVYQFTTTVGGTGRGNFQPGADIPNPAAGEVVAADFNGDGILDLADTGGGLQVRLGTGGGSYGTATSYASAGGGFSLTAGDIDADGDLDLVVPTSGGGISVLRNDGTGVFTAATPAASTGSDPRKTALGDLDGDGDLDMVVPFLAGQNGGVSVYRNDGSGTFTLLTTMKEAPNAVYVALGDVDNDGDLDFAVSDYFYNRVVVYRNDGSATFVVSGTVGVANYPNALALADLNGDGALDLVTASEATAALTVSLNANNGTGSFGGRSDYAVPATVSGLAMGDVDADGDLDVVASSRGGTGSYQLLNGGAGTFTLGSPIAGPTPFYYLTLADLDNDGDLDLASASLSGGLSVRLNQVPAPTLTAVSPAAELPGTVVTLIGTGFAAGSTVSFGGTAATGVTVVSATSLTVTVPASLAAGSAPIVVSAAGGTSAALPFTALAVYTGGTLDACTNAVPATASLNDGAWHYLLSTGGQVVAAYQYTGASLGNLAVDVLRADPTKPVRQDGGGRKYLDRNFHLTASAGRFDGRTVALRLYGLNTEQARLQYADPTATLANLKATQYSGPNEDCQLDNNSASGERRTLAAPASSPVSTTYFVAQLSVADHFSEFYLTGSPTPLPVELTTFTVTAVGNATVRLAWATASELNSHSFEVERSPDGVTFGKMGTLAAAGISLTPRAYALLDAQLPTGATVLYYRLRQVDQDGTAHYSGVRTVALTGASAGLSLYPNPAHGGPAMLLGAQPGTMVTVLDALGRSIVTAPADARGTATLVLPQGLATGVYVVRAGQQALRLTVE
jgi:hypothetical protein